jgi:hypothetical protein
LVRFVGKSEPVKCFIEPEKLSIRVFAFLAERRVSQPFGVSRYFRSRSGEQPVSFFSRWFVSLENLNLSSVFLNLRS